MKILLINPNTSDLYGKWQDTSGIWPPLGIAYPAAMLRKIGNHDVKIIDANAENLDFDTILKRVTEFKPGLVGISSVTTLITASLHLANLIKKELDVPIVFGGTHVTAASVDTMKNDCVDFVMRGEAEHTIVELVDALEKGITFENIKGLTYRKDGKVYENPSREFIENLDEIPWPAYDLLPMDKYKTRSYTDNGRNWFSIAGTRGCASLCNFCSAPIQLGRKARFRSPKDVVDEMEYLRDNYGVGNFTFVDSTMTVSKRRTMELAQMMIDRNLNVEWQCETRVTSADEEMFALMYKAGCKHVAFGIESGDERVLKIIKKGITIDLCFKAVKAAKKVGMITLSSWIFGHTGETKESAMNTIKLAVKLNTDIAFFFIMVPFPGTEVYDKVEEFGGEKVDDWSQYSIGYNKKLPCIESPELTREDLENFVSMAHRKFYFRFGYLLNHLKHLNNWTRVKREFRSLQQVLSVALQKPKLKAMPEKVSTA